MTLVKLREPATMLALRENATDGVSAERSSASCAAAEGELTMARGLCHSEGERAPFPEFGPGRATDPKSGPPSSPESWSQPALLLHSGLISNNNETHYRDEVAQQAEWCGANNLFLNVSKTKEVVMGFRRNSGDHPPLTIDSSTVERVSIIKFLGVHITEDLTCTTNTTSLSKKAQQCPHFLRRLKRASLPPPILTPIYGGTIESVLTSCITVCYGNSSAADPPADCEHIFKDHRAPLPSILDIFLAQCSSKANSIVKDPTHPFHSLFQLLPSGRWYRSIRARSARLLNSFFSPGCESPELNSPLPLETWTITSPPNTPQPYHITEKTLKIFCAICNNFVQHSPLFTLDTFHTLLYVQNPTKRLNSICMFKCSCTTNHLTLFPS